MQEAALLPGSAALTVLISQRWMCQCIWIPRWDVLLKHLPRHTRDEASLNRRPCCGGSCVRRTPQCELHPTHFGEGLVNRFLTPGTDIIVSSKKESLKCTFSRRSLGTVIMSLKQRWMFGLDEGL